MIRGDKLSNDFLNLHKTREIIYNIFSTIYSKELNENSLKIIDELLRFFKNISSDDNTRINKGIYLIEKEMQKPNFLEEQLTNFTGLFLNGGRNPVYIYESVYLSNEHLIMQEERDEVLEFYRKAGFEKNPEYNEPEDHLAIELEFMEILCEKIIRNIEKQDISKALECLDIQEDFLKQHLYKWIGLFVERMEEVEKESFYLGAAYLLKDFLKKETDFLPFYKEKMTVSI